MRHASLLVLLLCFFLFIPFSLGRTTWPHPFLCSTRALRRQSSEVCNKYNDSVSLLFLCVNLHWQCRIIQKRSPISRGSISSRRYLENLDEGELFMELIRDIANELDINVLCHKILVNVGLLTHADRGSLFLANGPPNNRHLVAKLFDVTQDTRETTKRILDKSEQSEQNEFVFCVSRLQCSMKPSAKLLAKKSSFRLGWGLPAQWLKQRR